MRHTLRRATSKPAGVCQIPLSVLGQRVDAAAHGSLGYKLEESGVLEPRVRYAQTDDGVSIAFTSAGSGPALILLPTVPFGYFQREWDIPEYRQVFEALVQHMRLVQYDARGNGLSQREVGDVSFEAMLRDLVAVAQAADLERFALLGMFSGCPIALAYAATHPEQVSHLVLWAAFASGPVAQADPQTQALLSLIERDWSLFTETAAALWMGWLPVVAARQVALSFRAAVTPDMARAMLGAAIQTDVRALLHDVRAPTMVLHRAGMPFGVNGPREVVANIHAAQLEVLPGDSTNPYFGDWTPIVQEVLRFCLANPDFTFAVTTDVPAAPSAAPSDSLTMRELEVLRRLAAGDANQQIARSLGVSVHTVERHVVNIYHKIDARGRADATAYAFRHGLA